MKKNPKTLKPFAASLAALLAILSLLLATGSARAQTDLIVNGDMASGKTGWTPVHDPSMLWGSWDEVGIPPFGEQNMLTNGIWDGTDLYKLGFSGGTVTNEGVRVYQEFGAAPGALYTLACDAGTQDWWLPWAQIELIFLNATNGVVGSNVVRFTDSLHDDFNGSTNKYDAAGGVLMQRVTNSAAAPVDTAKVRAVLANVHGTVAPSGGTNAGSGGNAFFDNVSLISPVVPPVIVDVSPDGSMLHVATNTLSFTANSAAGITNVSLLLNGVDVSADLVITGPATSQSVAYTNLQANKIYAADITATDSAGLSTALSVGFDTYSPILTIEGEDYNFFAGGFIDDPNPGDYSSLGGFEGTDFHDYNAAGGDAYGRGDPMATEVASDAARQKFIDAGTNDYNVGFFSGGGFLGGGILGITNYDSGEWVNYTRTFPAGTYNIYGRLARGDGATGTLPMSKVTSDPSLPNQTTAELGSMTFPSTGWQSYQYAPLTDQFGNLAEVTLSGVETLRLSSIEDVNVNFFMLVAVDPDQITITDVYPDGSTLLQGTNELTFTVSSTSSTIAQSNVVVTLNGADISGSLTFSGSASSWNVSGPLDLGVTNYTGVISAVDDAGNSHSVTVFFDTFDPAGFVVEAEDFDYSGGSFIDNPVITSNNAANSYFDALGANARVPVAGTDFYIGDNPPNTNDAPAITFRYRANDSDTNTSGEYVTVATDVTYDTPLQKLVDAQATNALAFGYNVSYARSNSWYNYTRTYPAGDYNVYARLSAQFGLAYSLPFEDVTGGTTNLLGNFEGVGRDFFFYDWIPLMDGGSLAKVTLAGGVATLRLNTPVGEVNPNSFVFVPAVATPATLSITDIGGGQVKVEWDTSGTLEEASPFGGAWSPVAGSPTSPYTNTVSGERYYRVVD